MRMETMRQKQLAEELARPASTPVKPTKAWLGASPASSGRASTHATPPPASSSADDEAADGGMVRVRVGVRPHPHPNPHPNPNPNQVGWTEG